MDPDGAAAEYEYVMWATVEELPHHKFLTTRELQLVVVVLPVAHHLLPPQVDVVVETARVRNSSTPATVEVADRSRTKRTLSSPYAATEKAMRL